MFLTTNQMIKNSKRAKKNLGMALVEIVIGSAIMSIGILAITVSYNTYIDYALSHQKNAEAAYLISEGLEVVSFFRDAGWDERIRGMSTTTPHYLAFASGNWATSTTPEYVDGVFERVVNIEDVVRDVNDDISETGTYDPYTKKVTVTVSYWQGHSTTTKSLSAYITNIGN